MFNRQQAKNARDIAKAYGKSIASNLQTSPNVERTNVSVAANLANHSVLKGANKPFAVAQKNVEAFAQRLLQSINGDTPAPTRTANPA